MPTFVKDKGGNINNLTKDKTNIQTCGKRKKHIGGWYTNILSRIYTRACCNRRNKMGFCCLPFLPVTNRDFSPTQQPTYCILASGITSALRNAQISLMHQPLIGNRRTQKFGQRTSPSFCQGEGILPHFCVFVNILQVNI